MTSDTKPSNPKDIIGSSKLPLELVPDTAVSYMALAFLEGALKYGRYNWRVAGVRSSIYRAAMHRHMMKWWNGEDVDPITEVPHLASIMACCGIILDAELVNKLVDDRPPASPMGDLVDTLSGNVAHIKDLYVGINPRQWTIADTEGTGDAWEPEPEAGSTRRRAWSMPDGSTHTVPHWDTLGITYSEALERWKITPKPDPTDEAYEAAVCPVEEDEEMPPIPLVPHRFVTKTYSASPIAGVTLGPYSSQEALDKALYEWPDYWEVLGETRDQRAARLRREQGK